jgi:hypothetical protein
MVMQQARKSKARAALVHTCKHNKHWLAGYTMLQQTAGGAGNAVRPRKPVLSPQKGQR